MAEFELTPEAINEAAATQAEEVKASVEDVAAQAAALDLAPAFDLEPAEEKVEEKKEDSLAQFTADEQRQIREVADKIDITDSNAVLGYGASAQRKVADFADGALQSVRAKDRDWPGAHIASRRTQDKRRREEGLLRQAVWKRREEL